MTLRDIALEEIDLEWVDGVATLRLNRPHRLNAITPALIAEAVTVIGGLAGDDRTRVMVLCGAGRAFSSGVDVGVLGQPGFTREDGLRFNESARELTNLLSTVPWPVIAKVHGLCLAGGLELALACDLIVASEDAEFCDDHARLAFRPSWGLSQRLPRRVGAMRAREMSFTGRRVSAQEAAEIGLVLECVPTARLDRRVDELVAQMLRSSAGSIAAYKELYRVAENSALDDGLQFEATTRFRIADRRTRQRELIERLARNQAAPSA
jgi:enoyl-CoA hydratase